MDERRGSYRYGEEDGRSGSASRGSVGRRLSDEQRAPRSSDAADGYRRPARDDGAQARYARDSYGSAGSRERRDARSPRSASGSRDSRSSSTDRRDDRREYRGSGDVRRTPRLAADEARYRDERIPRIEGDPRRCDSYDSRSPGDRGGGSRPRNPQARSSGGGKGRIIALIVIAAVLIAAIVFAVVTCNGGQQVDEQKAAQVQQSLDASVASTVQKVNESKAGVVPESVGVEDRWLPGGRFTTGDAELDQMVKDICDFEYGSTSDDRDDRMFHTWLYITQHEYVERYDGETYENQHPTGPDWDVLYAKQYCWSGEGNCYEFAAIAQYAFRYYGYSDAVAQPCLVQQQSGAWGQHGLVFVTDSDGSPCLNNCSFSANGWMLPGGSYNFDIENIGQGPVTLWANSTPTPYNQ